MVIDIMILALLRMGPRHGYDIKKRVEHILQRKAKLNTNLLYPALHRLEQSGAIERSEQEQGGKPTKFVYRLTPLGEHHLRNLIEEFGEAEAAKEEEFLVRMACFDLIEERSRLRILDQRRRAIEQKLARGERIRAYMAEENNSPWIERIVSFGERRNRAELRWIEELKGVASEPSSDAVTAAAPGGMKS